MCQCFDSCFMSDVVKADAIDGKNDISLSDPTFPGSYTISSNGANTDGKITIRTPFTSCNGKPKTTWTTFERYVMNTRKDYRQVNATLKS